MQLAELPNGSRGFDINIPLTRQMVKAFRDHGKERWSNVDYARLRYKYAIRYVPRVTQHPIDLTRAELETIIEGGLGIQVVQHVPNEDWVPDPVAGSAWGEKAAQQADRAGYLKGAQLWCDLEGVKLGVPSATIIQYLKNWCTEVRAAGYLPGLYVGWRCGLSAYELYWKLPFQRYWSAYNCNPSNIPSERGVCMKQYPWPPAAQRVVGIPVDYDEDVIQADHMGGTPKLVMPDGDF